MKQAFWTGVLILVTTTPLFAQDRAASPPRLRFRTAGTAANAASTESVGSLSSARMRYRRLNGRWWYWMPSEEWAYWDGSEWTVVEQGSANMTNLASSSSTATAR